MGHMLRAHARTTPVCPTATQNPICIRLCPVYLYIFHVVTEKGALPANLSLAEHTSLGIMHRLSLAKGLGVA